MTFNIENETLTLFFEGELNSFNSEEVEKEVENILEQKGFKGIRIDMADLVYISSAGLRTLLVCKKAMPSQGRIVIRNANENVMEIFEITGFSNLLDFE